MHIFKSRQLMDQKCPENWVSLNMHTFSSCYFLKLHSVKSGDCLKEDWGNGPRGTGLASTHTVHTRTERYDTCGLELESPKPTCLSSISCYKKHSRQCGREGLCQLTVPGPNPSQKSQWWELEGVGHIVSITQNTEEGTHECFLCSAHFLHFIQSRIPTPTVGMPCHLN